MARADVSAVLDAQGLPNANQVGEPHLSYIYIYPS